MKINVASPRYMVVLMLGWLIYSGKSTPANGQQEFSIRTSKLSYEATVGYDTVNYISIEIPSVFTNTTWRPVYFRGCGPPKAPMLEKQIGNQWVTVYFPIYFLCEGPPIRVMPGESIKLPSTIGACFSGQNCGPEFRGEVAGIYRLRQVIHLHKEGDEKLPIELSVSNSFELHTVRK